MDCAEPGPFFDLALESRELHARWAEELFRETGIDVGYRRCGILRCTFAAGAALSRSRQWQSAAGLSVEPLDPFRAGSRTDGRLAAGIAEALFFPGEAVVDSALFTRAVAISAQMRGARIFSNTAAKRFRIRSDVCVGVETERGALDSPRVVNAAGSWASFDDQLAFEVPVEPVRGQILELACERELPVAVEGDDAYLVPRRGGRILVGATVERVGFRNQVTAGGVSALLSGALRLVPDLAGAEFRGAWSGLRPGTPDGFPILGLSPVAGLFLATGHFRSGILLAPVTALRMASLLLGDAVSGLEAFSLSRFDAA